MIVNSAREWKRRKKITFILMILLKTNILANL